MSSWLTRHSEWLDHAYFQGQLYNVGTYPGVIRSSNPTDRVFGDVFRMNRPDFVLDRLDRYEGCHKLQPEPHEYVRVVGKVLRLQGEEIDAWIYLYNQPYEKLEKIVSGHFFAR